MMNLEYEFRNKKSKFVETTKEKTFPLKELINKLFAAPIDHDNRDSTKVLETITTIGV